MGGIHGVLTVRGLVVVVVVVVVVSLEPTGQIRYRAIISSSLYDIGAPQLLSTPIEGSK